MKQILSIFLILILILNMVLLALKKIQPLYFWIIIAVIGFIAFKVAPKIK